MVERIRSIAQGHPDPQQTMTDADAYIGELVKAGQHRVAADLALLLGRTLVQVTYQDGETASLPIVYGADIRDWWIWDNGMPLTRGVVAWTGANLHTEQHGIALRLCLSVWENPHPDKQVAALDFVSSMDTEAAPFCVALTVEELESP